MRAGSTSGCCSSTSSARARSHRFWVSGLAPAATACTRLTSQRVLVGRVPVGALAEAAQIGSEDDVAAPRRVGARSRRCARRSRRGSRRRRGRRPPTCPVRDRAARAPRVRARVRSCGHEQERGHRHRRPRCRTRSTARGRSRSRRVSRTSRSSGTGSGIGPSEACRDARARAHATPGSRPGRRSGTGRAARSPRVAASSTPRARSCRRRTRSRAVAERPARGCRRGAAGTPGSPRRRGSDRGSSTRPARRPRSKHHASGKPNAGRLAPGRVEIELRVRDAQQDAGVGTQVAELVHLVAPPPATRRGGASRDGRARRPRGRPPASTDDRRSAPRRCIQQETANEYTIDIGNHQSRGPLVRHQGGLSQAQHHSVGASHQNADCPDGRCRE